MVIGMIAGAGTVVAVVVVAKYKANEAQKAAAAARARAATVALAQQAPVTTRRPKEQAAAKRLSKKADPTALATTVEKPQPEKKNAAVAAIPARHVPTADEMEEAITHKIPAYLAVPVPKQQIAAEEKGEATYMLWDTHRQQLVTDDVYVLKKDVRAGVTVKLDGVKAQIASAE